MQLLKIGNRVINVEHITHVSFEPEAINPQVTSESWAECVVSFTTDNLQVFYGTEAEQAWKYLSFAAKDDL